MTDDLKELLTAAAENLSGHPVRVRWRRPSRIDAKAIAFKLGNEAVIDLHPSYNWDGETLLETLCHEAAHIRQLWHGWSGIRDYPSGSIRPSNYALSLPGVKQTETAADTLAGKWLDYARSNNRRYYEPGDDEFLLTLRTLKGMKP